MTQLLQRLQHRKVGFPVFMLLDTVSAPDAYAPPSLRLGKEMLHQRRLADTGLARDEDDMSLGLLHACVPRPQLRQLVLPPNKRGFQCHVPRVKLAIVVLDW